MTGTTDATLVERMLAGDREALGEVYDRYGDRLYDFAHGMLRQQQDAEDAVADSFVLAAERLGQLRDPERLRPWLYAIVRSECLRRLKGRSRVAFGGDEAMADMADGARGPEAEAEVAALRTLVWDASAGLAERDRTLLDLHLRHGLEGAELGEAMGVSASNAYVMLSRVRDQVERSLGALLIARLGRDDCDDLDAFLADWDGRFSPLVRKRVARHVDGCDVCGRRRAAMLSPLALFAGVPAMAAPLALRDRVVTDTVLVAHSVPSGPSGSGGFWTRRRTQAAAALGTAALVAGGTATIWPGWALGDDPDAPPPVAAAAPTPTPSATPEPTATDEAPTDPTPSTTPAAGVLTVSTRTVDLGSDGSAASVVVTNTGGTSLAFTAASSASWLSVTPRSSSLAGGRTTDLRITADRDRVDEGASSATVTVASAAGRVPITVRLVREVPPTASAPRFSRTLCRDTGRVVVTSATASDDAESATLTWSGQAGSGRVAMTRSGGGWSATMGPFTSGGTVSARVTVTDDDGAGSTGPASSLTVEPCPG